MPTETLDILRELPPLLPQFLRKRRVGITAPSEIAAELGIERPLIFVMMQLDFISGMYGQEGVTFSQFRSYDAYSVIDNDGPQIAILKDKGLILEDEGGMLTLSPVARDALDRFHAAGIAYIAARMPLPEATMTQLADEIERAANAVIANSPFINDPGSHLRGYKQASRYGIRNNAPMVRLERAIYNLWGARDDAHMAAWRNAGLDGPPFDVLSHIWSGVTTLDALTEALKYKQTPDDIDSSLTYLAERELAERHGNDLRLTPKGALVREDVERETDRLFFAGWPFTFDEAVWVRDTLSNLVESL